MNSIFSLLSIERPQVLLFVFIVIPAVAFMFYRFYRLVRTLGEFYSVKDSRIIHVKKSFILRTVFRAASFVSAVIAFSGMSWGTRQIPVQKSGFAVSFVFDISFSMNAVDEREHSRLDAVKIYARNLLSHMDGISVSAVLAKGDGFIAVPLTEDFSSIESLIDSLSPYLMTSAGSSIGRGIECAISSFPQNSAQSNIIFVFTDGDETDDSLFPALMDAARFQIPVSLIGFGSEDGVEVLSGDGKTPIRTFLMANKMKNLADDVNKNSRKIYSNPNLVRYVTADSKGSALKLLDQFKSSSESFSYEVRTVPRHDTFLFIAVVLFILSFVFGEIDATSLRRRFGKISLVSLFAFMFVSCTSERAKILEGAFAYHNGKYRSATADFLSVESETNDADVKSFALFGLASTYISLEEYDAALEKLNSIVPERIDDEYKDPVFASHVFYNMGIIYERKGDFNQAKELFKRAVLANSENLDAKINFELCVQMESSKKVKSEDTELKTAKESKTDDIDPKSSAIFNLIRENEQNQWKMMESKEVKSDEIDY